MGSTIYERLGPKPAKYSMGQALGDAIRGGGAYFGAVAVEKAKAEALQQARAAKLEDREADQAFTTSEREASQQASLDLASAKRTPKTQVVEIEGKQVIVDAQGDVVKVLGSKDETITPDAALAALPKGQQAMAREAYNVAGGGKEGLAAIDASVSTQKDQARWNDVPNILDSNFPNATKAEREQLETTIGVSSDVETGLKNATKIREEQRRLKKVQAVQSRAVELLGRISKNDQLGDVTGSIEGAYDTRLVSDAESELIADIGEVSNILTSENLDMMTGVLSESDMKIIRQVSAGALIRTRSEETFLADIKKLQTALSNTMVQTVDDTYVPKDEGAGGSIAPPTASQIAALMEIRKDLTREQIIEALTDG